MNIMKNNKIFMMDFVNHRIFYIILYIIKSKFDYNGSS